MDIEDPFSLIGKSMIVGITYVDADGSPRESVQHFGTVRIEDNAITIQATGERRNWQTVILERGGKEVTRFPYDKRALQVANPGIYRLRGTGEEIENPDLLSTWTVHEPRSEMPVATPYGLNGQQSGVS